MNRRNFLKILAAGSAGSLLITGCNDGQKKETKEMVTEIDVPAIEYTAKYNDGILKMLAKELEYSFHFGKRNGLTQENEFLLYEDEQRAYFIFDYFSILNLANPGLLASYSTELKIGQKLIIPDLSKDGKIAGNGGEYKGHFKFTGKRFGRLPLEKKCSYFDLDGKEHSVTFDTKFTQGIQQDPAERSPLPN